MKMEKTSWWIRASTSSPRGGPRWRGRRRCLPRGTDRVDHLIIYIITMSFSSLEWVENKENDSVPVIRGTCSLDNRAPSSWTRTAAPRRRLWKDDKYSQKICITKRNKIIPAQKLTISVNKKHTWWRSWRTTPFWRSGSSRERLTIRPRAALLIILFTASRRTSWDGSTREQFCNTNWLDTYSFLIQKILEHKQKRKTNPTICLAVFICSRAILWWS